MYTIAKRSKQILDIPPVSVYNAMALISLFVMADQNK